MAAAAIPAALVCWMASTVIGETAILLFPILILVPAMRLDKWY